MHHPKSMAPSDCVSPDSRSKQALDVSYRNRISYKGRNRRQGCRRRQELHFSTGPFVEPITRWDEPNRLSFDVASQPCPMKEWSPYNIHPPHLDHHLISKKGEFRLIRLEGNRTRLEGSTWYSNNMWPNGYWGFGQMRFSTEFICGCWITSE